MGLARVGPGHVSGSHCAFIQHVAKEQQTQNAYWSNTGVCLSTFLCMHKILVHAQHSCACTTLLCMHWRGQGPRPGPKKKRRGSGPGWPLALDHHDHDHDHDHDDDDDHDQDDDDYVVTT